MYLYLKYVFDIIRTKSQYTVTFFYWRRPWILVHGFRLLGSGAGASMCQTIKQDSRVLEYSLWLKL